MPFLLCVATIFWVPTSTLAFGLGAGGITGPPTVTSTHPADATNGVAVRGTITATFSEAMDPATITGATFTVTGPDRTSLKGTVGYDASSRTATFTPSDALAPGTRYSVTMTRAAQDESGTAMSADVVWSFTTGRGIDQDKPIMSLEKEPDYSYLIPALEILGYEVALNGIDRLSDRATYGVNLRTIQHNLENPWVFDTDPFSTNQIMHPLGGSIYYGFARSAGLSFWESLAYTFMGSLMWEYAGETGAPSVNDQITTTLGGSFLGEALYRMANLVLAGGGGGRPGFWRELGAAVISPPTGFNRNLMCGRFDYILPDYDPEIFLRLRLGGSLRTQQTDTGVSRNVNRYEAVGDLSLAYGLPGKPGYEYKRPFDYFEFEGTLSSSSSATFENVTVRGLLLGTRVDEGTDYRGVIGLYGSYDYISPEIFRISSTALSLGTTGQAWLTRTVAIQGSLLGGVGFGSAGTIPAVGQRDYHYGTIPQALVAMRLIFSDVAMFDLTAREYYVMGLGIDGFYGHENIVRGQASFTVRIFGQHALGIQWVAAERDAHYVAIPSRHQTSGTFSLVYNFLGDTKFGAVEWRNPEGR